MYTLHTVYTYLSLHLHRAVEEDSTLSQPVDIKGLINVEIQDNVGWSHDHMILCSYVYTMWLGSSVGQLCTL